MRIQVIAFIFRILLIVKCSRKTFKYYVKLRIAQKSDSLGFLDKVIDGKKGLLFLLNIDKVDQETMKSFEKFMPFFYRKVEKDGPQKYTNNGKSTCSDNNAANDRNQRSVVYIENGEHSITFIKNKEGNVYVTNLSRIHHRMNITDLKEKSVVFYIPFEYDHGAYENCIAKRVARKNTEPNDDIISYELIPVNGGDGTDKPTHLENRNLPNPKSLPN